MNSAEIEEDDIPISPIVRMACDDIIRDWNDDTDDIKEEQVSEDEHTNDGRSHDETDNSELIEGTFEGCYYFVEGNKCKLDFIKEDQDESDQSTNHSNFDAVISEPTENEVMVSMDPIVASKVYIDENDDVRNEPTIENKKKQKRSRSRFNLYHALFSYATEDTERSGPESGVPKSSNVAELANPSISPLHVHAEDRKREKEKPFECGICGSKFLLKHNLTTHMLRHTRRTTQLRCKICRMVFVRKCNLNTHMMSHRQECGKIVSTQDNSFVATSVHSAERPHVCFVCGSSFKRKDVLKTHMIVHSEERPFVCSMCDSSFKFRSVLKTHVMLVHSNNEKKKLAASFKCEVCSLSFPKKSQFQKHVRAHAYEQYKFSLLPATHV